MSDENEIDLGITSPEHGSTDMLAAENAQAAELARQLGYDGTVTVGAVEDHIRLYQRQSVMACLELGKGLLLLKALTPHGEFEKRVALLGFEKTKASRFMRSAAKTAKSSNLQLLSEQTKNFSVFWEIIMSDDDVVENILEWDDIDRMSASELRARLRQLESGETEKVARLSRELNDTEKKLEIFERQLNRTQVPGDGEFDPRTFEVRQEAAALEYGARIHMDDLETLFEQLLTEVADPQAQVLRMRSVGIAVGGLLSRAQSLFELLREGMGDDMPVVPHGDLFLSESEKDTLEAGLTIIRENHKRRKGERADEATRQAAAHQKGPGRRIGSKNKKGSEA